MHLKTTSLILALLVAITLAFPTLADSFRVGDLVVESPWFRASAGAAKSGVAFMAIMNNGGTADHLVSVSSTAAKMAHLHTTIMENDVMKMRALDALEIPVGGMAILKPGSTHVMFMGLNAPLKEGETFPLTLEFEKAGTLEITANVMKVGAMGNLDGTNMGN
jgi:copper(I)-binding protein